MLKMSPFITFLLYCVFISFTTYYLTKDKLDETSRYILIGVLILPYIFMDQSENFSNMIKENKENIENNEITDNEENIENYAEINSLPKIEQPKIILNQNEKVENLKAIEEIMKKEENNKKKEESNKKKEEAEKMIEQMNKKTFTIEEVSKLLKIANSKNKLTEKYGSMYTGEVSKEYNEDYSFTNQLLKPLGQNGNGLTNAWDHDYILLNTDKWGPALNPPPVCKTEKKCPVCPNLTTGYPLMLRDFDSTRRITPPINANIPLMNKTDSVEPTNADESNNTNQDNTNQENTNQENENGRLFGMRLFAIINSVPEENRPALMAEVAKFLNIEVSVLNMMLQLENAKNSPSGIYM